MDLVDCSSGGNWVKQKITVGPGYQVSYAALSPLAFNVTLQC